MKRTIRFFVPIIFAMTLIVALSCIRPYTVKGKENDVKYVLVINSYHQEMTWTKEETEGITKSLADSGKNINVFIEYMDWKNYPNESNIKYLYQYYKYKYANKKIDLIMTTDDAALEFALEHRKDIFSDAPVIFCGVNKEGAETITKGYHNLTGAIEVIDPSETIKLAVHINPSLKNLYLLYDNTESGFTTGELVIKEVRARYPNLKTISLNEQSYEEVLNTVKQLNKDSAVIMTTYSSDVNNKIMDMDYIIRNISKVSSVPVYHLYNFGIVNGAFGGVMLSGEKGGESAAALALRVLDGEKPDHIPFLLPKATRSAVNYQQFVRYGINTKDIPKGFEIVNKPFSFYETYKSLIIKVLFLFVVLVIFISILFFNYLRIKRMKKNLADNHEELTQLYEELTASDEEMKQQYEEIIVINEKIRIGEEKLSYLAYHDTLTNLPNKLSLYENTKHIFSPEKGTSAVLFLDIDNFKNVNDTMGHAFGDQLVKKVSERLTSLFEAADTIYRLGGDEFIILIQNNCDSNNVQKIAENILKEFAKEFEIEGSTLHVSMSIGIAIYPDHGTTLDQLLRYADIAMYKVKESGKTNYLLYDNEMKELFIERVNIEKYLPKALENNEFILYYQPQYDIKQNKVTGFEALLRWKSPELGEVSPLKFIKIAEDSRLIVGLGKWVLQSACDFIKRIHTMGYSDLVISVNISIIQLMQKDFCNMIYETLKKCQLDAKYLELEITETILIESIDKIGEDLKKLSEMDVKIALDDFGKGYSSLNYLRQLPISTLKVDKAFIDGINGQSANTLAGNIVILGKSLSMNIVAEGVETKEQLEYLKQYDCDKFQGYLYSRPKPEEEIVEMLQQAYVLT